MKKIKEVNLAVGEKWQYSGGGLSYVLIQKIQKRQGRTIVHLTVLNIKTKNGYVDIAHVPIDLETLQKSLTKKIEGKYKGNDTTRFTEGYDAWRENKGGAWPIPVSEVVKLTI